MKLTRFSNARHIRGAACSLLLPILLMTAVCNDKFEVSIYKPDKICDSYTPATHAAIGQTPVIDKEEKSIDGQPCTENPVKLLRGSTTIFSSEVGAGYPQGSGVGSARIAALPRLPGTQEQR